MNKTMITSRLTCQRVEEFLMAYVDKELDTVSRLRFQFHLAICSNCRNYLNEYQNAVFLGKKVFSNPEELAAGNVPDEILQAILDASNTS